METVAPPRAGGTGAEPGSPPVPSSTPASTAGSVAGSAAIPRRTKRECERPKPGLRTVCWGQKDTFATIVLTPDFPPPPTMNEVAGDGSSLTRTTPGRPEVLESGRRRDGREAHHEGAAQREETQDTIRRTHAIEGERVVLRGWSR